MSPLVWLWLGLAVSLVPAATPATMRAAALTAGGRLGGQLGGRLGDRAVRPGPTWLLATPRARAPVCAAAVVAATAVVAVGAGVAVGIAALLAAGTACRLALSAATRRTRQRHEEQLLAALRLVCAELEAGASVGGALVAAADHAEARDPSLANALQTAAVAIEAGDPPAADGALAVLAPAWRLAATTGAPLAEVCRRVTQDLGARIEQRQAVAAALAGARSSAALLAVLPVLGLLLGTAMQARPIAILFGTAAGHGVLVVGVALDAAGLLWTHWLAARAEGP